VSVLHRAGAALLALALFAICSPAVAGDKAADAVRKQFTAAQWKQLMSLKHTSVILPAHLPAGYRVARVEVNHLRENPRNESFSIFYSNGIRTLSWGGSNWTAGGDPEPEAFQAKWKSPTLGNGIVFMIKGVAGPTGSVGRPTSGCPTDTPTISRSIPRPDITASSCCRPAIRAWRRPRWRV